jgi:hypothetical protein
MTSPGAANKGIAEKRVHIISSKRPQGEKSKNEINKLIHLFITASQQFSNRMIVIRL